MAGAVAAVTSRIKVGTWVLVGPAIAIRASPPRPSRRSTRSAADGSSSGSARVMPEPGQAHAFGLPEDKIFARFEEALQVIVPLLREGRADVEGDVARRAAISPSSRRARDRAASR